MASGRHHDRTTKLLALPAALLVWPWLGWPGVSAAALGFLAGGLLLSPDLDTVSRPTARWGILAALWWPYRHLLRHRSVLSHSPLLGTAGRLSYLACMVLAVAAMSQPFGGPTPASLWQQGLLLWQQQRELIIAAVVGVEASSWLHLIQDGDPMPRLPRALRCLGHRRRRSRK